LNGPKFPYENENDYCGPCRLAIFAELRNQEADSSQPIFSNSVVHTHFEERSTSSSTVLKSSNYAEVPVGNIDNFGERLRAGMASRNESLGQSEITAKTEAAMAEYRARRGTPTQLATVPVSKGNGNVESKIAGKGGPIVVAKQLQATAAQAKDIVPTKDQKKPKKESSPPSSDDDLPTSSSRPTRAKMVLKQGPIPKKGREEAELEELMADQARKKDADRVMLWRKLQAEIAKTAAFATE
jgi:hypothetical protein